MIPPVAAIDDFGIQPNIRGAADGNFRMALPVMAGKTKVAGIEIHDTRMMRLMEVLLHGGTQLKRVALRRHPPSHPRHLRPTPRSIASPAKRSRPTPRSKPPTARPIAPSNTCSICSPHEILRDEFSKFTRLKT
ncbi:MAG: hypothetical protein ABSF64_04395 [Bryobacteraceae bacterium]